MHPRLLVATSSRDEIPVRGEIGYEPFSVGAINVTGTRFDVEVGRMCKVPRHGQSRASRRPTALRIGPGHHGKYHIQSSSASIAGG
jgi:hypothetical protein